MSQREKQPLNLCGESEGGDDTPFIVMVTRHGGAWRGEAGTLKGKEWLEGRKSERTTIRKQENFKETCRGREALRGVARNGMVKGKKSERKRTRNQENLKEIQTCGMEGEVKYS